VADRLSADIAMPEPAWDNRWAGARQAGRPALCRPNFPDLIFVMVGRPKNAFDFNHISVASKPWRKHRRNPESGSYA
jgi:hypothetical protein